MNVMFLVLCVVFGMVAVIAQVIDTWIYKNPRLELDSPDFGVGIRRLQNRARVVKKVSFAVCLAMLVLTFITAL